MKKNKFELSTKQLKEIALLLHRKVKTGLTESNTEIQCLPTFISPQPNAVKGKSLVLDLGGTNYRAAIVEFLEGRHVVRPEGGWKKDLSVMKAIDYTKEDLFEAQGDFISEVKHRDPMPIGYCFSYPARSLTNGDAKLLRWTKGVKIKNMVGKPIGEPLLEYLNKINKDEGQFTGIKVINDTVASLFAGLTDNNYDAYIGLIVGTGTNMATFLPKSKIEKLRSKSKELLPVNLESGNFFPEGYLTEYDNEVDAISDIKGAQRFEKAVSGMYLGEILKAVFPDLEFERNFDAQKLTRIMNYPDIHKDEIVDVARSIYQRSAKLVAASLAGLISVIVSSYDKPVRKVCLTAEGSLFWSKDSKGTDYNKLVMDELHNLLKELELRNTKVYFNQMEDANLIGSAIAALSGK